MEKLKLSRDERNVLVGHVVQTGGWPAGFGRHGTDIAVLTTPDGSIELDSEALGDLWPTLLALATDAGVTAKAEEPPAPVEPEPEPATPE